MKRLICTVLAVILMLTCVPATQAAGAYDKNNLHYDDAFAFLELLNQKRASMGLGALTMDQDLLEGASIRAYEQITYFGHTRPDGSKYSTAAPGKAHAECVHWWSPAEQSTPQNTLKEFLNSPPHKAILLDGQYRAAGVGAYESGGRKYWAMLLSLNSASTSAVVNQPKPRATVGSFRDVYETDYFAQPVLWAVQNKITNGTTASTFSPNQACTRGQIVTFLWRTVGSPMLHNTNNPFRDVKSGSFYYNAVLWAHENGITSGTSSRAFSPDQSCSRAEAATFLWRALGCQSDMEKVHSFQDIPKGAYYETAALWLRDFDIVSGTSATRFSPSRTCTRAEVVTMLYRVDAKHLPWFASKGDAV